jgi:hypothetical protein
VFTNTKRGTLLLGKVWPLPLLNLEKPNQRKNTRLHKAFNPQDSNTLQEGVTVTNERACPEEGTLATSHRLRPPISHPARLRSRHPLPPPRHFYSARTRRPLCPPQPKPLHQKKPPSTSTPPLESLALQQGRISPRRRPRLHHNGGGGSLRMGRGAPVMSIWPPSSGCSCFSMTGRTRRSTLLISPRGLRNPQLVVVLGTEALRLPPNHRLGNSFRFTC